MRSGWTLLQVLCAAVALGGCATIAVPPYAPSVASVGVVARLAGPVAVGRFEFDRGREAELNSVGARASSFQSPINRSYADYFADAAAKELKAAGKFDASAPRVLTGVIVRNYLSGAGATANQSDLQVRFRLASGAATLYDKLLQAQGEWEASFMGAIAIPRALDNYVATLQRLLRSLFADPDFIRASGSQAPGPAALRP